MAWLPFAMQSSRKSALSATFINDGRSLNLMAIMQHRPRLKPSGSRYVPYRKKRKSVMGRLPTLTRVGAEKSKTSRVLGGNHKYRLISAEKANVYDPKSKKHSVVAIKNAVENPANK